jgi:hypothetical protein
VQPQLSLDQPAFFVNAAILASGLRRLRGINALRPAPITPGRSWRRLLNPFCTHLVYSISLS